MLFVLVMEALNSLIKQADRLDALQPLPAQVRAHRASLYADDLVLLLTPSTEDMLCLVHILELFAGASGLVTNIDKCVVTPICCDDEDIAVVQSAFPCVVSHFPCKYLGISLSLGRLRRAEEQPLVDAVSARIPTWKAGLLTNAGRVLLTKAGLSIACCLSPWAVQQIDKRRRTFLWSGADSCTSGKCRVSWPGVCRPTDLGGLGVIDLRFFSFALRLRWEWLARTEPERCWVSLPHRKEKCVAAMCAASMSVIVGDGASARLWTDNWLPVGPLCAHAPALYKAISRAGKKRSVCDALVHNQWVRDITAAATAAVLCDYLRVWRLLRSVTLQPLVPDRFVWKWS
jgi:hypothetical protein